MKGDEAPGEKKMSKKARKLASRLTVAELKQLVRRPDVVVLPRPVGVQAVTLRPRALAGRIWHSELNCHLRPPVEPPRR